VMRIVEYHENGGNTQTETFLKNERIFEYDHKKYLVRIGVIDLEGKLYTKLPVYLKDVEDAYHSFVKYYN
jgi:hypothetical protein